MEQEPSADDKRVQEMYQKYIGDGYVSEQPKESIEYKVFKKYKKSGSMVFYEKVVKKLGSLLRLEMSTGEKGVLANSIAILDLDITAEQVASASIITLLLSLFPSIILILLNPMIGLFGIFIGIGLYMYMRNLPSRFVEQRKIRASGEVVLAVLYIVTYMRHSSNLEAAVKFAADNLRGPLANDFVKLMWDVEAKKFGSISDALDPYLQMWKDVYPSFVDSMYLIRSVLFQTDEMYRMQLLDEAVERVLDGTYTNMTRYASSLRNPINTIYMLGIVLPVLGMVMFPMLTSFMAGSIPTESLMFGYNILLPIFVYLMVRNVLKKRPSGFPHPSLDEHPDVPKKYHFFFRGRQMHVLIPTVLVFIGFMIPSYLLMSSVPIESDVQVYFSLIPIFGVTFTIYTFTRLSSSLRMKVIRQIDDIERDFAHAVFQLGSLLSQDIPAEQAMMKVSDSMKGSATSQFFNRIVNNIRNLGLSFKDAIFDAKHGALWYYPSPIIRSTMEVLFETSKKSLKHAGVTMIFISKYLRSLKDIDRKVTEIMDEVLSSMNFQVVFLSPIISGIVVGLTSLITMVLSGLAGRLADISQLAGSGGGDVPVASLGFMVGIFQMSQGTPLGLFQIMVGLYTIEVIIIICYTIANIERIGDDTYRDSRIANTIILPVIIYSAVAGFTTLIMGGLATMAIGIGGMMGGG
jgi:hypothetical protein